MQTIEYEMVIVDSFLKFDLSNLIAPTIVVSKDPDGMPEKFIARLFELDKPLEYVMIRYSLSEVVARLPKGFVNFNRFTNDAPVILKFWA